MNDGPIQSAEFEQAMAQLDTGLTALLHAHRILNRFAKHGLVNEADNELLDRNRDETARLRAQIGQLGLVRRKLQKRAARKREIEAERARNK